MSIPTPDIADYVNMKIADSAGYPIADLAKQVITATRWNELFNLVLVASDYQDEAIDLLAASVLLKSDKTYVDGLDAANVKLTGNQTIAGIKTLSSSPIVPTPTTDMQASTKKYVDDQRTAHEGSTAHDDRYYTESEVDGFAVKLTGNQTVAGVKTFASSPIVPAPTTDLQAATKKYADDLNTAQSGALTTHKSSSDHDARYYTRTTDNLLKDGTFEGLYIFDDIHIADGHDTAAVTSKTPTGTNIKLTLSNTEYRSGAQSLRAEKVGGANTLAGFIIVVPISKKIAPTMQLYYKKPGSGTGSISMSWGYCKPGATNYTYQTEQKGSLTENFTSAAVDWTAPYGFSAGLGSSPAWATHMYIFVSLFFFSGGYIYFDDIVMRET